ncbi:MAG: DNA recombination protein RmuC [Bacteroidales bacterium]|nr:DNA recombination protein RmuC [Bacteroidales bacterium]
MDQTVLTVIILAAVAVLLTFLITFLLLNSRNRVNMARMQGEVNSLGDQVKERDERITGLRGRLDSERERLEGVRRDEITALKEERDKQLRELKEEQQNQLAALKKERDEQLEKVVANVRNELRLEYEESLKARKEELAKGNKSDIEGILNPLKESIEGMRKVMKENSEEHLKSTTELRSQLEQAVKEMGARTADLGAKADSLSEALSGRPKMQGNWGENMLDSILAQEGLIKGMHYTREDAREDQSRPDFIFHFKDGSQEKDLIVDSKVSLTAFVRYVNAENEDERKAALEEHLQSINRHIDELARKEYFKKVDKGRAFTDQVVMFMPIDQAFRLALDAKPTLWQDAYSKGVLIATEQTIMPFLKILQLTWNKYQQDSNLQEIRDAAERMIERVGLFYDSYKDLGKRLKATVDTYNEGITKLEDNGRSITTAAKQVMKFGVKRSKGKEFQVPAETLALPDLDAENAD